MTPHFHAFGPGDITAVAIVPGAALPLEEVTDFSISTHFDKIPIRRLGERLPVGFATGMGTIAGSLVCAQFTQGALWSLRRHAAAIRYFQNEALVEATVDTDSGAPARARLDFYTSSVLPQQLPPFHLMFVHTNETGQMAIARLYNVVISDQGEAKGARNSFTEEMLQYQATYYEQIRLHKTLTGEQIAQLANRPVGFFNDPRRVETLPQSLGSIMPGMSAQDYILSEIEDYTERMKTGQVTSTGLANTGNVLWVSQKAAQPAEDSGTTAPAPSDTETPEQNTPVIERPGITTDQREFNLTLADYLVELAPETGIPTAANYTQAVRLTYKGLRGTLQRSDGTNTWSAAFVPGDFGQMQVTLGANFYSALMRGSSETEPIWFAPSSYRLLLTPARLNTTSPPAENQTAEMPPVITRQYLYSQNVIMTASEPNEIDDPEIYPLNEGTAVWRGRYNGHNVKLTFKDAAYKVSTDRSTPVTLFIGAAPQNIAADGKLKMQLINTADNAVKLLKLHHDDVVITQEPVGS